VIYFQQAAEANNAAALFNLGICHETGVGTTQNLKKVKHLFFEEKFTQYAEY